MAGLFDPSMFDPSSFGGSQAGLLARLAGMAAYRPTPQSVLPGQPGTDAMASGIMPPQGPQAPQGGPPMGQPQGMPPMGANSGLLSSLFGNKDGSGFLNGLHNALQAHQGQLMGAAQLVGSGGLNQGALTQGMNQDYQRNMQQSSLAGTYQALIQAGVPEGVARAAALNPEILKTVAPQIYQKPSLVAGGTDPLTGQITHQLYDPNTQTLKNMTPDAASGGGGAMPATMQQVFDQIEAGRAKGASMPELLQAIPNSLRDGVSAMIEGRDIPAHLSMRGQARDMTVRFAHAVDPTFDETMIPARVQFAHGMAQTTPNSNGGQKILLNTALQHAGELSDQLVNLQNRNLDPISAIPGSDYLANTVNAIGNSRSNMGATTNAVGDISQKLSGEVGKLYSGSSGGGEAERQATAGRFSTSNTPNQSIGGLTATKNLILDKLNALQNQRDQVYGTHGERIYPLVDPQTKAAIDKIDANIAKLQGTQPTGASAPVKVSDKASYDQLPKGATYVAPDGSTRTKQ